MVLFSAVLVLSSSALSFSKSTYANTNEGQDLEGYIDLSEFLDLENIDDVLEARANRKMIETAEKISGFFSADESGNISLNADRDTLIRLGISEEDADLMILATTELTIIEVPEVQAHGFVGIHINLGPKTRKMNGWAAGAFAAGYVGWYAKQFATNPVTAGVAYTITAGTALAVKNAVEKNLKRVSIGINIPFVSKSYTINLP